MNTNNTSTTETSNNNTLNLSNTESTNSYLSDNTLEREQTTNATTNATRKTKEIYCTPLL
jgi:hypothetical protein